MTGPEMSRRIAEEVLGWKYAECEDGSGTIMVRGDDERPIRPYSTDANQAQAAVREWCGKDCGRRKEFSDELFDLLVYAKDSPILHEPYIYATATPEQLCRALLAAYDELKGGTT